MPSHKRLRAVVEDLGRHAQGAFSRLHPHLARAARAAGLARVTIDLLADDPFPDGMPRSQPLTLALASLQMRLYSVLAQKGFLPDDIASAAVTFSFHADPAEELDTAVDAVVAATSGQAYELHLPFVLGTASQVPSLPDAAAGGTG